MGHKRHSKGKKRGMATPPKPNGRIAFEHLDNGLIEIAHAKKRAWEFLMQAKDTKDCQQYGELIMILEAAINEIKLSKNPNGG